MKLNNLKPAKGSKSAPKRVGRGIGSGMGKTAGRGHKGQKSRSGGFHKIGFEGGQMPLQRRLPKVGFHSRTNSDNAEVRLYQLNQLKVDTVDMAALEEAGIVNPGVKRVKIIARGELERAVTVKGIAASKGAREAIEKAGGKVE